MPAKRRRWRLGRGHGLLAGPIASGYPGSRASALQGSSARPFSPTGTLWALSRSWTSAAPFRDAAPGRRPDAGGGGLAVPADRRDGLLAGVDAHRHARLPLGQPALARPPVSLGGVRVVAVGPAGPDAAPRHDAAPVAVDGGERAVAPLPGGAAADAAGLRAGAGRHGKRRQPDEGHPGRERLLAALETVPVSDVDLVCFVK